MPRLVRPLSVLRLSCVLWGLAGLCLPGQAQQLWGYVDGAGVAHFADSAVDSRYLPVLPEPGQLNIRVPGKTMSGNGLLTWLDIAPEVKRLQPVLKEAEETTGVDAELLKAIITVESGFNPELVSPRGAIGLMQMTPDAADRYATKAEAQAPAEQRMRNPRLNILTGARMLADLTRRYGGVDVALAAWNAGEGNVRRAGGKMPPFEETRAHVHMVLELYWTLLQQRLQTGAHQLKLVGWNEGAQPVR